MKRCIYCGEGGARTMVLLGFAHKMCMPKKVKKGYKVRNSIAKEIAREARRKYPEAKTEGSKPR